MGLKTWFSDRPVLTALAALTAPVLVGTVGLGLTGFLPSIRPSAIPLVQNLPGVPAEPSATPSVPTLPALSNQNVIPPGRPQIRVPILEYHYVRVNPDPRDRIGFNLSVTPPNFSAQMTWLAQNGFHPVDLNDLRAYFQQGQPLPARPVVLTFDDGYLDFYTSAFPVLLAHGFKAVSYVVSGFLERPEYMNAQDLVTLDRSGIEVGDHTANHLDLTTLNRTQLVTQVQGSKAALEKVLGHPVLDFCYPSGQLNPTVVADVQQAGFLSAASEQSGTTHSWASRMTWGRVRVNGGEGLEQFIASLGEPEPTVVVTPPPPPSAIPYVPGFKPPASSPSPAARPTVAPTP